MKLINCLSETIVRKGSLLEVSDKVKKALIIKYSGETKDSPEDIANYIDAFDNYKSDLPVEKRNIQALSYEELKSLIEGKKNKKLIDKIYTKFKKTEKGIENVSLIQNIRKFLDIQDILPEKERNIETLEYAQLVELINKVWNKKFTEKMIKKFISENPNLNQDQLLFYINAYTENLPIIPLDTKPVSKMSFVEFEHLIDEVLAKKGGGEKTKSNLEDIDLIYDENNLKVFAPKSKDQCIALRHGRSWCISREGGGNLYYNYRLGHDRTIYYVIDEDLPSNDTNFACVILVDPNGDIAVADKSNSGTWSGHNNIPWRDIVKKLPKLANLKHLFVPKPLTKEEKELINKIKRINVGNDVMASFDNENEAEMWLEVESPKLSDNQYASLTPKLKKKYISLGMQLNTNNINSSEPDVLSYYISKKVDTMKTKTLEELQTEEVSLLNTPMLKGLKAELKDKFARSLVGGMGAQGGDGNNLRIEGTKGIYGKFIALYGFDEIFNSIPETIKGIQITNETNNLFFKIPRTILRFKNLELLFFDNCIDEVPDFICELKKLTFFAAINNPKLESIPDCLGNMPSLVFINLTMCPNVKVPESVSSKAIDHGGGMWDFNV